MALNMLCPLLQRKTKIELNLRELCFRRVSSQHNLRILITDLELKMLATKPLLDLLVNYSNFKITAFGVVMLTKTADCTIHVPTLKILLKLQDSSTKNKLRSLSLNNSAKSEMWTKEGVNYVLQTVTSLRTTHTQRQKQELFNWGTIHGIWEVQQWITSDSVV